MEFNDSLISAIDSMGIIATTIGGLCFAIGFGIGLMEQRLTPIIIGVVVCLFFANAQDVMKAVAGIDEPSEEVLLLDDETARDKGGDTEAEPSGLRQVLSLFITLSIVFWLYKDVSAHAEAEYEIDRNQNQSPSPPEEIVLPNVQPEPEPQPMSSSVGSLKSTRRIQLD